MEYYNFNRKNFVSQYQKNSLGFVVNNWGFRKNSYIKGAIKILVAIFSSDSVARKLRGVDSDALNICKSFCNDWGWEW